MAVTVVKRPEGHKVIDQAIAADISDSGGDALVNFPYHALVDGDYVYIVSDIDEYNGFWYVDAITSSTFKLREYETADHVPYYQGIEIDYYRTNPHEWNSIFLPIIYKISNNRWPVNTINSPGLIILNSDDNGYTSLLLAAPIGGLSSALQYVKITGALSESANAVWQVVEIISSVQVVISMPSEIAGSLIGVSVQLYYNNYQVKVKIFAGLPAGHPWEAKKPYAEVAELSLTPDEDNIVMFSVADYIKTKIQVKNNTTLFSLPLNLDAFTGFYISFSETFDSSDGYTLTTDDSLPFEEDTFEGYAVAGKLPFKNVYSGDYSDYVYTSGSPALWLTNMERLLAVEGLYFDVSFIKNILGDFTLYIKKYIADYLTTIETIDFEDQGIGVYRIPIEVNSDYDSFCVYINVSDGVIPGTPGFTPFTLPALSVWGISNTSAEPIIWTGGSPNPFCDVNSAVSAGALSDWFGPAGPAFEAGQTYKYSYVIIADGVFNPSDYYDLKVRLVIGDLFFNILYEQSVTSSVGAVDEPFTDTVEFVAPVGSIRMAILLEFVDGVNGSGIAHVVIDSFTDETQSIPATPDQDINANITEEICIDIIGECDAQGGFTPTDRRLLEDGGYRLLE